MPFPCLAFCPYLDMNEPIEFGDWELGPLAAFEERWADLKFKTQAKAFLAKFVDGRGQPIERPSLLCHRQGLIDGALPSLQEIEALKAAIAFAFLDTNPRCTSSNRQHHVITADNTVSNWFFALRGRGRYLTLRTHPRIRTRSSPCMTFSFTGIMVPKNATVGNRRPKPWSSVGHGNGAESRTPYRLQR